MFYFPPWRITENPNFFMKYFSGEKSCDLFIGADFLLIACAFCIIYFGRKVKSAEMCVLR